MVMPLMTVYLAARFGAAVAGMMMLAAVSLEVAGTLVGGHLSDVHGRRPALLGGEIVTAAGYVAMAGASAPFLGSSIVVYCGFVVSTLGFSFALPANDAMIVDLTSSENRRFVYTVNYWTVNLALGCGALVGGFLYGEYFTHLLAAAAVCSLGVFAVTFGFITETAPVTSGAVTRQAYLDDFVSGYRLVLRSRIFTALLIAATLRMAVEVQINYYIAARISETFGRQSLFSIGSWDAAVSGVELLGILRAENTFLVVALAFAVHAILGRASDKLRLYLGTVVFIAGYMVLAVNNDAWVLIAAMFVLTVGELLGVPVQQAVLADLVPEESRTKYLAAYNLTIRVAFVIASLCLTIGPLISPWGMAALYALFGAIILFHYSLVLSDREKRVSQTATH